MIVLFYMVYLDRGDYFCFSLLEVITCLVELVGRGFNLILFISYHSRR